MKFFHPCTGCRKKSFFSTRIFSLTHTLTHTHTHTFFPLHTSQIFPSVPIFLLRLPDHIFSLLFHSASSSLLIPIPLSIPLPLSVRPINSPFLTATRLPYPFQIPLQSPQQNHKLFVTPNLFFFSSLISP